MKLRAAAATAKTAVQPDRPRVLSIVGHRRRSRIEKGAKRKESITPREAAKDCGGNDGGNDVKDDDCPLPESKLNARDRSNFRSELLEILTSGCADVCHMYKATGIAEADRELLGAEYDSFTNHIVHMLLDMNEAGKLAGVVDLSGLWARYQQLKVRKSELLARRSSGTFGDWFWDLFPCTRKLSAARLTLRLKVLRVLHNVEQ